MVRAGCWLSTEQQAPSADGLQATPCLSRRAPVLPQGWPSAPLRPTGRSLTVFWRRRPSGPIRNRPRSATPAFSPSCAGGARSRQVQVQGSGRGSGGARRCWAGTPRSRRARTAARPSPTGANSAAACPPTHNSTPLTSISTS